MADTPAFNGVTDNTERRRFELVENGLTAFADYHRRDDVLVVPHVEAPPALRGTGAAGRLMAGTLEHIRAAGLKIQPSCPYAAAYIRRHPEYADLVA
jgi:predicted GNAT family acetyltransferase